MPTCTKAALAETNPGFGLQGLNPRQYTAAMIRLKVLELAANGGTNYAAVMNTTLINDAKQLVATMDPNQRRIARLNIARQAAVTAGASVPATVNLLNAGTACCFQAMPDLDSILLFLECALGAHRTPPA